MSKKEHIKLTLGEEIGNSVTHGVMAVGLLIALPIFSVFAYLKGGWEYSFGISVFTISLFLMFLMSTLYHAMEHDTKHKQIMQILDHSAIYVAIAGSYTPVAISVIKGWQGVLILIVQWTMVLGGILYKSLARKRIPKASLVIYMTMGWVAVLFIPKLIQNADITFLIWIIIGGAFYSIGAWFYSQKHRAYFHFIWHIFIDLAAVSHIIAMLVFIK